MKCDECGQEVEDILCPDCIFEREEDSSWKDELIGELLETCDGLIGILTPKQYDKQFPNIYKKAKVIVAKVETLKSQGRLLLSDQPESDEHKPVL